MRLIVSSFARLLTINETVLSATPTLIKLRQLFDNYEIDTSVNEYVSPSERQEENEFLDAVLATPVMAAAMRFLQTKGKLITISATICQI